MRRGVSISLAKLKTNFMQEETIVRENLMNDKSYTGYCGSHMNSSCSWPRTKWDGEQFVCPECGWRSKYPDDFIKRYKEKHNL